MARSNGRAGVPSGIADLMQALQAKQFGGGTPDLSALSQAFAQAGIRQQTPGPPVRRTMLKRVRRSRQNQPLGAMQ